MMNKWSISPLHQHTRITPKLLNTKHQSSLIEAKDIFMFSPANQIHDIDCRRDIGVWEGDEVYDVRRGRRTGWTEGPELCCRLESLGRKRRKCFVFAGDRFFETAGAFRDSEAAATL